MYSESHEWFLIDGDVVTIGITKHAADELTDITYIELPSVGASVDAGSAFGEVESVKATSEIFSAVAGEIVEVNQALEDQPELVNNDPFGEGWIVRIKTSNMNPIRELMDAEGYEKAIL
jgi:glycine cleavage system H protein